MPPPVVVLHPARRYLGTEVRAARPAYHRPPRPPHRGQESQSIPRLPGPPGLVEPGSPGLREQGREEPCAFAVCGLARMPLVTVTCRLKSGDTPFTAQRALLVWDFRDWQRWTRKGLCRLVPATRHAICWRSPGPGIILPFAAASECVLGMWDAMRPFQKAHFRSPAAGKPSGQSGQSGQLCRQHWHTFCHFAHFANKPVAIAPLADDDGRRRQDRGRRTHWHHTKAYSGCPVCIWTQPWATR